jgi:hypothetical protein
MGDKQTVPDTTHISLSAGCRRNEEQVHIHKRLNIGLVSRCKYTLSVPKDGDNPWFIVGEPAYDDRPDASMIRKISLHISVFDPVTEGMETHLIILCEKRQELIDEEKTHVSVPNEVLDDFVLLQPSTVTAVQSLRQVPVKKSLHPSHYSEKITISQKPLTTNGVIPFLSSSSINSEFHCTPFSFTRSSRPPSGMILLHEIENR